ncbi:MAG: hypothetical protein DMG73_05435 [Acidobacteria bacterium]|nr:MAG: hypothetical protein DMG75_04775 [Acidobacteriota bacterium]PYX60813.1 MAG: hypothetical protein DMG73_05435 [Acidobacteriota bacterium]PYX64211.1 MAG: hypothetical protein DMG74_13850 [Acidobacteriota bacterium]
MDGGSESLLLFQMATYLSATGADKKKMEYKKLFAMTRILFARYLSGDFSTCDTRPHTSFFS